LTAIAGQPTNSYYGPWNALSFDVGSHVEHHDFPAVPWRRLRTLKAMAPEAYDGLFHVRSWTRLLVEYMTSSRYRVDQYVGRGAPVAERVEELQSSYGNDGALRPAVVARQFWSG
jgi:sphingolipid delta-4 desaturase